MNYKVLCGAAIAMALSACTGQSQNPSSAGTAYSEESAMPTVAAGGAMMKMAMASHPVTVVMNAQNGSGESGTATLAAAGTKTKVTLSLKGEPAAGKQPAHIHVGPCAKLGAVKYPLSDVIGGKSVTVVPAALKSLTVGNLAINVHESAANIGKYVSCGDIAKPKPGAM